MAYTKEQWNEAKFLWELDKPLSYIVEKTGISKAQISKKSNKEQWKKETEGNTLNTEIRELDKIKETIKQKETDLINRVSKLEGYQITILDEMIQDETGVKSLLFSTANLSLIRKNQLLTKNSKQVVEFETIYSEDGKPMSKTPVVIDIELSPADLKTIDEGIDKNAVSLEIAPRHSNSQVNIQNTNAVQTNNNIDIENMDAKQITNAYLDLIKK